MSCYSDHLLAHEMAAVSEYTLRLHEILGHELIGLWLFGSKVRGDWEPDSDVDFLLVLKSVLPETRWRAFTAGCLTCVGNRRLTVPKAVQLSA